MSLWLLISKGRIFVVLNDCDTVLLYCCLGISLSTYRRSGFNCEYLLNANCDVFKSSQSIDSQE